MVVGAATTRGDVAERLSVAVHFSGELICVKEDTREHGNFTDGPLTSLRCSKRCCHQWEGDGGRLKIVRRLGL